MMKTGMDGPGIGQMRETYLADTPETLEPWVLHQIKQKIVRDVNKPVNRVVYDFLFIHSAAKVVILTKIPTFLRNFSF